MDRDEATKKALKEMLIHEGTSEEKANNLIEGLEKTAKITGRDFYKNLLDVSKIMETCYGLEKRINNKNITYKDIMTFMSEVAVRLMEKEKISSIENIIDEIKLMTK